MKVCNVCSAVNHEGSRVCVKCGAELPDKIRPFGKGEDSAQDKTNGSAGGERTLFSEFGDDSFGSSAYDPKIEQSDAAVDRSKNEKSDKLHTVMRNVGIIFVVLCVVSIAVMIVTGYYDPDNGFSLFETHMDYGDTANVFCSNIVNKSSVVIDGDDTYYLSCNDEGEYSINCSDKKGDVRTVSVNSNYLTCLNVYKDRLYYVTAVNSRNCVCSVRKNGGDEKNEIKDQNPDYLYIFGEYAYYTISDYMQRGTGALFSKDLETGVIKPLLIMDNTEIDSVLVCEEKLYVYYYDLENYIGHIKCSSVEKADDFIDISPLGENKEGIQSMTFADGLIYFTNLSPGTSIYQLYSMKPDGSDVKKIAVNAGGIYLTAYGDYIFYVIPVKAEKEGSYMTELRRIKKDGGDSVTLKEEKMIFPGIADGIIHYTSGDGTYCSMKLK